MDATLSIGGGPVVAPAEVTPRLAVVASSYSIVAVAFVGLPLATGRRHDRLSGAACLALYLAAYAAVIRAG